MRDVRGVQGKGAGAPGAHQGARPSRGRSLLAAGGRIGEVIPREPADVTWAEAQSYGAPRHQGSAAEPGRSSELSRSGSRLLQITISPPAECAMPIEEQWRVLRSLAFFDAQSRTWRTVLGAMDQAALDVLSGCLELARVYGARVDVEAVAAPDEWLGPAFDWPSNGIASIERLKF